MFNSCYWNRYRNPLTDQYNSFLRDIKPLKEVCLIVEYTVLSLPFVILYSILTEIATYESTQGEED